MSMAPPIERPVPCARCGYDLRATAMGGTCPECGLPVVAGRSGFYVDGKYLVARSEVELPGRCVKTNEPVDGKAITKTLSWANPAVSLLVLVNVIVLIIVYMIVRKQCRITFYLSPAVRRRIGIRVLIPLLVMLGGIGAIVVGIQLSEALPVVVGIAVTLISMITAAMLARPLVIAKAKDGRFWIKGCGREFLASLEQVPPTA